MKTILLDRIIVDPSVDVRAKLNPKTVEQYMDRLDELPPVVLFGTLLADGFHRVAAARKLGRDSIKAEVKRGGRDEAMVYAASANTTHGVPLTQKERRAAAERLLKMTKKPQRQIARDLGMASATVTEIAEGLAVSARIRAPESLSPSHLDMLSRAPAEHQQALADAAEKRGWTAHETRQAAQVVKDERTPPKHREEVLAGESDPFPLDEQGEPTVSKDTIKRRAAEAKNHGLSVPLHTMVSAAATIEQRVAEGEHFEDRLTAKDRQRLDRDLQRIEESLPRIRELLTGTGVRPFAIQGGRA
jgi:ParB-like chromosome segregation protein Spo0J